MLILDTYNILHAARTAGVGHVNGTTLKQWITASRFASEHTILVFDGNSGSITLRHPSEPGVAIPSRAAGISELHAGAGSEADAVIEAILEHEDRLGRGRLAVVVSSDNRVRAAARAARARAIGSAAFLRTLVEDLRKQHDRERDQTGGRPAHATDEGADSGRTEYWLRAFGEAAESESSVEDSRPDRSEVDLNGIDMERLLAEHPPPKRAQREEDPDERDRD